MSFYKKSFAATTALVLLAQQALFAFPTTAALQRDARRFKNIQQADGQEQQVQLAPTVAVGLESFNDRTDSAYTIRINSASGTPRSLVKGDNLTVGKSSSKAISFLKKYKDMLGVDTAQLKVKIQRQSPVGYHFYFDQYYKNLKVENAYVKVNTDKSGKLINYQSTYVKDLATDITPVKSATEASSIAAADCGGTAQNAQLVIYAATDGSAPLAWKVQATGGAGEPGKWTYFVNATSGVILNRISLVMAADTLNASLSPVYPGFGSTTNQIYPLENMDVYYFTSGSTVAKAVTNGSGQVNVSRTGRLFATFSGPYFTVTNQKQNSGVTGYYVEKGLSGSTQEPISVDASAWTSYTKPAGTPTPVYNACASGSYPVFTSPLVNSDFSVGYMDNYGIISDKVFMKVTNPVESNRVLGAYIGVPGAAFYGPAIPTASTAQTMGTALAPTGSSGTYNIDNMYKLCVPYSITSGYSQVTTHTVTNEPNNEVTANVFYQLNKMRDFFVTLNTGNYINLNSHLPVMVNAFGLPYASSGYNGMLNAFYDTDQKLIMYGEGLKTSDSYNFRNFGLENAVVRHEYVHAVVDNIWPILYFGEGAAVSEAVSDYFALSSIKNVGGTPYTSKIGEWVNPDSSTTSGESVVRDLSGTDTFDAATWAANSIYGQHKNSLVLSQALWDLRTASATANYTDKLVWGALMFFPDSLLEFRDAMIASAQAQAADFGTDFSSNVAAAFDAHGITFSAIVTLNGDVYEPNNSPESAADIDVTSISKRSLNAKINPASDMDFYSVSLPEGRFEATINLPQVANMSPARYLGFGMFLLDANLKTVVDIVSPELTGGQYNITTASPTVKLTYDAPALLSGNTGRYILGVFKMDQAYYPTDVSTDTGAYSIDFKFASSSNIGGVSTSIPTFANGVTVNLTAPYTTAKAVNANALAAIDPALADWAPSSSSPNNEEAFYSVRVLDEDLNPITGADTVTGTYLALSGTPSYSSATGTVSASVQFAGNFEDLGYNTIYLQVFGKLRSNVSGVNSAYPANYGIVSLGISNPIRNTVTSGKEIYMRKAVFNPANGSKIKIEIAPPQAGRIKVQIFTVDGLLVKTLKDGDITTSLPDTLEWDGSNDAGNTVASGLYLLRIDGAGINKQLKKIVVVK